MGVDKSRPHAPVLQHTITHAHPHAQLSQITLSFTFFFLFKLLNSGAPCSPHHSSKQTWTLPSLLSGVEWSR